MTILLSVWMVFSLQNVAPRQVVPVPDVAILEWGEFEVCRPRAERRAPESSTGSVHELGPLDDPKRKAHTDRIQADLGVHFGIRFQVMGSTQGDQVPLRIRVLHPPIRNPETSRTSRKDEWEMSANIGIPRYTGWEFEKQWEVVPGAWTFQVLFGDSVRAEKKFLIETRSGSPAR